MGRAEDHNNQAGSVDRFRRGKRLNDIIVRKYKYGSVVCNEYATTMATVPYFLSTRELHL